MPTDQAYREELQLAAGFKIYRITKPPVEPRTSRGYPHPVSVWLAGVQYTAIGTRSQWAYYCGVLCNIQQYRLEALGQTMQEVINRPPNTKWQRLEAKLGVPLEKYFERQLARGNSIASIEARLGLKPKTWYRLRQLKGLTVDKAGRAGKLIAKYSLQAVGGSGYESK